MLMLQEFQSENKEQVLCSTLLQMQILSSGDEASVPGEVQLSRDESLTETPQCVHLFSLEQFVTFELSLVEEVETVLIARHENLFYLWIVIDGFEDVVRNKIYAREKAIIDEFEEHEFDFNIVSRRGRNLSELLSDAELKVTFHRSLWGLQGDHADHCRTLE